MNRTMHAYRTHHCGELRASHVGERVKLSGWIHRKRDHGGVLFVDLRDHYGLTQVVAKANSEPLRLLEHLRAQSVITIVSQGVSRRPLPRLPASAPASSPFAAAASTATSCFARRSSRRSAAGWSRPASPSSR